MPFAFVRPRDSRVLEGRPLLDLGCGDGQTILELTGGAGVVGLDRSAEALRAARRSGLGRLVRAEARSLPLRQASVAVVLAADLFHHLDDPALDSVLAEIARVLEKGGRTVAWWYAAAGTGALDDPPYPRSFEEVAERAVRAGLDPVPLAIERAGGWKACISEGRSTVGALLLRTARPPALRRAGPAGRGN